MVHYVKMKCHRANNLVFCSKQVKQVGEAGPVRMRLETTSRHGSLNL